MKKKKIYQKKRVLMPTITAIIFLAFGISSIINSYHYQSTDDAYIEGHLVSVSPRSYGQVVKIYVEDNQEVKKGQLLFEIDKKDYVIKLHQAQAKLAEDKANLKVADAKIFQNQSIIDQVVQDKNSSDSNLQFFQNEFERYSKMYEIGVSSKQEYEKSLNNLNLKKAAQKSTDEKVKESKVALRIARAKKEVVMANILKDEAEVEQAELNLSYTKVFAPQDGHICSKNIEVGNYIKVAQPVLSIVSPDRWVVANFKETQLLNIKKGQPVSMLIDTYPNRKFQGKVDSIQRTSGAKSSLFPPENAVGSYVKIVQRIPVKILFTEDYSQFDIAPGMSVIPKVKIK